MRPFMECLLFFVAILFRIIVAKSSVCGTIPKSCPSITDSYRSLDGTCNNLENPWWGTARSEYDRIRPACYGDGISIPRKANDGNDLPNARTVRVTCLPDDRIVPDKEITRAFIPALQLFTHDIIESQLHSQDTSDCCSSSLTNLPSPPGHCVNIKIPEGDPVYSEYGITCLPMVDNVNNFDLKCGNENAEAQQINTETHLMDLSNIYGTTEKENRALRTGKGGLLLLENRNGSDYLPNDPSGSRCQIPFNTKEVCYKAGDDRVNQNLDLAIAHTYWARYHNKIACELAEINPCWDDEMLFQETRKITIAAYQKIMFYDVFPWVLGYDNMYANGLIYFSLSHVDDYNSKCRPNVYNEFVFGAWRGLHSMLIGKLALYNEDRELLGHIPLRDHFFRPQILEQDNNFERLSIGQATQYPNYHGPNFDAEITNYMYPIILRLGTDLASLDIERSRITGCPPYNEMRQDAGLCLANTFDDFSDSIDSEHIAKLKSVYSNVNDVDLYVGGLLERNYPGANVGPTFYQIILKQLKRLRQCDRFWYEHSQAGFTVEQLLEIKKASISGLICENSNIKSMQVDALRPPTGINFPVRCSVIPKLDLSKWRDNTCK